MRTELPPLPEKKTVITMVEGRAVTFSGYSTEQMQAHALAAVLAERNACADYLASRSVPEDGDGDMIAGVKGSVRLLSKAVRAGARSAPQPPAPPTKPQ